MHADGPRLLRRVYYVDNAVCPDVGEGTQDDPFCALESVLDLDNTPSGESSVAIVIGNAAETYREHVEFPGAWPRRIAVLGHGTVTIGFSAIPGPVFEVKTGSQLYLQNVTLTRSAESGVRCADTTAWLDDVTLTRNAVGIDADGCDLVVRQSQISENDGDGIRLVGQSALRSWKRRGAWPWRSCSTILAAVHGWNGGPRAQRCYRGTGADLTSISCPWADIETSFIDTLRNPESNPWRELAVPGTIGSAGADEP